MNVVVIGILKKALEPISGQNENGAWYLQDFVVETYETNKKGQQYPVPIKISLDKEEYAQQLEQMIGQEITAYCSLRSTESKGRWFTNLKAYSVRSGVHSQQA